MSQMKEFSYEEINLNSEINYNSNDSFIEEQKNNCPFCPKLFNFIEKAKMVTRALYYKYSSSQNYFYSKEINNFMETPTDLKIRSRLINFQDLIAIEERNDYFTKLFNKTERLEKLKFLVEYYKYHNEIPRMFLRPIQKKMNKYYDKKRQIQYYRIKKMLESRNLKSKQQHVVQEHLEEKSIKYTQLLKQLDLSKSIVALEKSIVKENPLLAFQFFQQNLNKEEQFQYLNLNQKLKDQSICLSIVINDQRKYTPNQNYSISMLEEKPNDETLEEYNQYVDFILKSSNIQLQNKQLKQKQTTSEQKENLKDQSINQIEIQKENNKKFAFSKKQENKQTQQQITSNETLPNSSFGKINQKSNKNNQPSSEESQSSYNQININRKSFSNQNQTKPLKSPSQESIRSPIETSKAFKLAPQKIEVDNNNELTKQNVKIKFCKSKSRSSSKFKKDLKLQDSIIKNPIQLDRRPSYEHRGPSPDLSQEKVKKQNFDFNTLNQLKAQTTKFSERKPITGKNFSDLQKQQNIEAQNSEIEESLKKPNAQQQQFQQQQFQQQQFQQQQFQQQQFQQQQQQQKQQQLQQQQLQTTYQQLNSSEKPNFRAKPSIQAKFQLLEIYSSAKNQKPLIAHTQHFIPQKQLTSTELSKIYCASLLSIQSQKPTFQLQPKSFQAENGRKNNFQRKTDRSGEIAVRSLKRNIEHEGALSQGRKGLSENRMRESYSVRRLTNIQQQLLPQSNCNYGWQSQRTNSLTKISRKKSQSPQILVGENQMQTYKDLQKQLIISNQKNKQKRVIQFASASQNQRSSSLNTNPVAFQPYQQMVKNINSPKAQKIKFNIQPNQMQMSYKTFAKSQIPLAVQQQNMKQKLITIKRNKQINKFVSKCLK